MKVVLLRDVARIGKRREIKEVPSGHAINFLIPRKLALPATPENVRRVTAIKEQEETRVKHHSANFKAALLKFETMPVELSIDANAQGHLFKGIHVADIAKRFSELNIPIAESEIILAQPIKSIGDHEIALRADGEEGTCILRVLAR